MDNNNIKKNAKDKNKKRIIQLRSRARVLKPTLQIGKQGLTPQIINELKLQLKARKLVKIKLLRSAADDKEEILNILVNQTSSTLIQKIGNVIVLYKP
ncbi:YhbY family RNA-binding protein [Candidatus Woesearchaeota archaeon]|nr:YhbY family RNA-binding protein [Candidatus Woesearchaeota archaeon]